jgi:ABC-type lipoprotein release transport system permease subunit
LSDVIIVALISLIGTLGGSFLGVITSTKLTNYRIEQLEKKVEKHNGVIERVFKLEGQVEELEHFHEGQAN